MDGKDDNPSVSLSPVYAPFTCEAMEAKFCDDFMKSLVPDVTGLFHAVETFGQMHDPVLFAGSFKSRRLFHEDCLSFRQHTV